MTYSSGSIIDDGDYNTFATGSVTGATNHNVQNVNTLWGTGTSNKGYVQSGPIAAVAPGSIITATQWSNLFNRIDTIANHQGSTITPLTNPTVGDEITAYNTFVTNLNTIWNQRLNCAANGTVGQTTTTRTASWVTQVSFVMKATFTSANARRAFFNAGGYLAVSFSRTGGTVSAKNTEWTDLLNKVGSPTLTAATPGLNGGLANLSGTNYTGFNRIGGSGTMAVFESAIGFYQLTTANQLMLQQYADTAPYTTNNIQIQMRSTAANEVVFDCLLVDNDSGTDPANTVDGTLTCTISATPPSTTHISNSWGTVTLSGTQAGS